MQLLQQARKNTHAQREHRDCARVCTFEALSYPILGFRAVTSMREVDIISWIRSLPPTDGPFENEPRAGRATRTLGYKGHKHQLPRARQEPETTKGCAAQTYGTATLSIPYRFCEAGKHVCRHDRTLILGRLPQSPRWQDCTASTTL